jgi:hypothetical protein
MYFNVKKATVVAVSTLVLAACASTGDQDVIDTERRLAAAGFQMKLADTPEKLAHLNRFGQRRLVPMEKDGDTVFIYADGESCKCVYVGSQANYQEYERLSIQQHVVDERRQTAEVYNAAASTEAFNWDMWGAWPRPILY